MAAIYHRFPRLKERRRQPAGLLSGGEQQILAIGRAMMAGPGVLLLDEPSMRLAPLTMSKIFALLADFNGQGMAILLVEQNARKALALASARLRAGGWPDRAGGVIMRALEIACDRRCLSRRGERSLTAIES